MGRRPDLPPPTTNIANTVAMADHRMTYRRRQPYNTVSNKVRTIRTPGGEHRLLNTKKKGTNPKCGDCGSKLAGVCLPTTPILTATLSCNDLFSPETLHAQWPVRETGC